ncbi:M23 family metallopeptidase [Nocardia puris]|uniref:Transglycosylase-like protein with SLT domain n=1 Tax=Nocardia puris TaxID=208602 RepID=A0A366D5K5_9NOCA|nr:M23 family metallopeptidase [Nocardia puris]RBO85323.1 transglycosylase-like protein with SLT domain [Nocardia puris]
MKSIGAALISVVVAVVPLLLLLVVIDTPGCGPVPSGPGAGMALPAGSTSMPMAQGTYTLTSGYGPRWGTFHFGTDFGADAGQPIYAVADGVVAAVGPATGFGTWIVLDHNVNGSSYSSVYGHMFADDIDPAVVVGASVRAGQQVAKVGYAGEVSPPGPGGAHLHLEIWEGTRLGGGRAIDPMPWLAGALEPGSAGPEPSAPGPVPPGLDSRAAAGVAELPPLPASVGSEDKLQIDAVRVARLVAARFPEVTTIGGWRPPDAYGEHSAGRAVDVMIPGYSSGTGKELGDRITQFLLAHAAELHIEYLIWRQLYIPGTGSPSMMEDRGSPTANHYDHIHVSVSGGGLPDGSTPIGPGPAAPSPGVGPGSGSECGPGGGEDDLAPGRVPPEYEEMYRRAGTLCPQIRPSLLAAQGKQESGFDPNAVSSAGAQGISQFMPETWPTYGLTDEDGNGRLSPFDPADAIMAQGRYMCEIAAQVDGWIDDGKVIDAGGREELYLAAYNAGPGAVLRNRGFPVDGHDYIVQTRPYADIILATAREYSTTLS